tara:strand:+ start:1363 stop:1527 length:165 start_codon:yes stop_codon:yes gene_type:complete
VIAEGVQTIQHDLLISTGCDYEQGYLFLKPVPAEEFEQLIAYESIWLTVNEVAD